MCRRWIQAYPLRAVPGGALAPLDRPVSERVVPVLPGPAPAHAELVVPCIRVARQRFAEGFADALRRGRRLRRHAKNQLVRRLCSAIA